MRWKGKGRTGLTVGRRGWVGLGNGRVELRSGWRSCLKIFYSFLGGGDGNGDD